MLSVSLSSLVSRCNL